MRCRSMQRIGGMMFLPSFNDKSACILSLSFHYFTVSPLSLFFFLFFPFFPHSSSSSGKFPNTLTCFMQVWLFLHEAASILSDLHSTVGTNPCFSFTMSSSLKPCSSPYTSTTSAKDTEEVSQQQPVNSAITNTTKHHSSCCATNTTKTMDTIPRFFFPFGKPVVPEERECKDRKIMVSDIHIFLPSNAPFPSPMLNILALSLILIHAFSLYCRHHHILVNCPPALWLSAFSVRNTICSYNKDM